MARGVLLMCWLLIVVPCCAARDASTQVRPGRLVDGRPTGMYFMTRYWSFTRTLEKAAWYFAPDGKVYQNLTGGFTPAVLAAHAPQGSCRRVGAELQVNWADGTSNQSEIEIEGDGFMWEMGIFSPALPFGNRDEAVGHYEGSERISVGGDTAAVAKTLTLAADGSFHWEGIGFVEATGTAAILTAASDSGTRGTWQLDGYTLTLESTDGKAVCDIAFPVDESDTPLKPDRLFFGGMLYRRLE